MPSLKDVPLRGDRDIVPCPTCGYPVRIVRREGGYADHYKHIRDDNLDKQLPSQDAETATKLHKLRSGKKTVALVGLSPSSCSLAPFEDDEVEIWCLNEAHDFPWLLRATRWFQLHPRESFMREVAVRNVRGHYDWLKDEHGFLIYMQFQHEDVPDSVEYPLLDMLDEFFGKTRKGDEKVKYFTSTFAYMVALAISEGFERIEVYGFEMTNEEEWSAQKSCAEFWLGVIIGRKLELLLPEDSRLLWGPLYGYEGQGPKNLSVADMDIREHVGGN